MVGLRRLENLRELTQRVVDEGIPGDLIETGAWRGGCCILMRGVLKANGVTDRKVYVANSFRGLPPPDPEFEQDRGHDYSKNEQLAVSVDQVQANFARYGLLDDQVIFIEGLFQVTLPHLRIGPFALLRLDGDLYEVHSRRLGEPLPEAVAGRFRDRGRLWRHASLPPGGRGLPEQDWDHRADHRDRLDRCLVAEAIGGPVASEVTEPGGGRRDS